MKKGIKCYLLILGNLILGMTVFVSFQKLTLPSWLNPSVVILVVFILLNLVQTYFFNLKNEIKEFWSIRKILYFPIGVICGAIIAISPTLLAVMFGQLPTSEITFSTDFTIYSICLTMVIVSWEELWFRGIFLNYCHKHVSEIIISLTIGLLFALIHVLNPKINLIQTGPSLFFAGALLTIVYFYFKTIWLPIGIHFGNNFSNSIISAKFETNSIFGSEGYIGALILATLFLIFVKLTIDKHPKPL